MATNSVTLPAVGDPHWAAPSTAANLPTTDQTYSTRLVTDTGAIQYWNGSAWVATTADYAALTVNRAVITDGSGTPAAAATTATQIGYLSSATGTTGTISTNLVYSTSPTLVTPTLGAATVTSINKMAITAPATASTLAVADGKTLTCSNTLTLTGTDASSVALGTGGTVVYTSNNLSALAATTSAQFAGVISDAIGTGKVILQTSPTLITPVLGVASATSINKVALTAPATSSTITVADGKTLTASNTLTFTGTDSSSVAFGTGGTVAYTANNLSVFASTTSAQFAGVISDATGTGNVVLKTSPTLVTPTLGVASATSINFGGNALSTYSEGTWTCTDNSGAGLSLTVTDARYTKIGRMVFISAHIVFPSTANTNAVAFAGLPFTAFNGTNSSDGIGVTFTDSGRSDLFYVNKNTTTISSATNLNGNIQNVAYSTKNLWISGWYMATS